MNKKGTVLHYVISTITAIVSIVLLVIAVTNLRTGLIPEAENAFMLSFALMFILVIYLFFIRKHFISFSPINTNNIKISFIF